MIIYVNDEIMIKMKLTPKQAPRIDNHCYLQPCHETNPPFVLASVVFVY